MIIIFVGIKIMRIEILNKKICFGGIVSNIDLTKDFDKNSGISSNDDHIQKILIKILSKKLIMS